ncbi:MAG: hypothetical protein AB7R89_03090 [Dehalococcoidia bacterium]
MSDVDALDDLEALVRERLNLAMHDKVLFERDRQRLNSQLMQGEINMGTAVLGWIEHHRHGSADEAIDEDSGEFEPEA